MKKEDKERKAQVWIWLLVALLSLIMLHGCTKTVYIPVEHKTTETIETIVRDTIVEVEMQSERVEVGTTDSVSVLMTERATSRAEVSRGVLHHSLYVFPASVPVSVPTVTVSKTRRDSIPYPVEVEKVVEVVPTWAWWSLAIAGVCVAGATLYIIGNIKKA
ncbi:MAG: hypothetical protein J6V00_03085 [Bacteroidaceae bacterium]|nr:hypothetical protein [Bacteroidaceae bacterium]